MNIQSAEYDFGTLAEIDTDTNISYLVAFDNFDDGACHVTARVWDHDKIDNYACGEIVRNDFIANSNAATATHYL